MVLSQFANFTGVLPLESNKIGFKTFRSSFSGETAIANAMLFFSCQRNAAIEGITKYLEANLIAQCGSKSDQEKFKPKSLYVISAKGYAVVADIRGDRIPNTSSAVARTDSELFYLERSASGALTFRPEVMAPLFKRFSGEKPLVWTPELEKGEKDRDSGDGGDQVLNRSESSSSMPDSDEACNSIIVKDRAHHRKPYSNTFYGPDAVNWILRHSSVISRDEAIALSSQFVALGWVTSISEPGEPGIKDIKNTLYHLTSAGAKLAGWTGEKSGSSSPGVFRARKGAADDRFRAQGSLPGKTTHISTENLAKFDNFLRKSSERLHGSDMGSESCGRPQGFIDPTAGDESFARTTASTERKRASTIGGPLPVDAFKVASSSTTYPLVMFDRRRSSLGDEGSRSAAPEMKETNAMKMSTIFALPDLRNPFRAYLASMYCEENFGFWADAERFRIAYDGDDVDHVLITESQFKATATAGSHDDPLLIPHAIAIYLKYIVTDAPFEVNIGSNLKRQIGEVMEIAKPFFGMIDVKSFRMESTIDPDTLLMPGIKLDSFPTNLAKFGPMMFAPVEAHIFRLMAGDSVPKFIRTEIYQQTAAKLTREGILPLRAVMQVVSTTDLRAVGEGGNCGIPLARSSSTSSVASTSEGRRKSMILPVVSPEVVGTARPQSSVAPKGQRSGRGSVSHAISELGSSIVSQMGGEGVEAVIRVRKRAATVGAVPAPAPAVTSERTSTVSMSENSRQAQLSRKLLDPLFRVDFMKFLEATHCEENFHFWLDVECFKKAYIPDEIEAKPSPLLIPHALAIHLKYISSRALMEINVHQLMKAKTTKCMEEALHLESRINAKIVFSKESINPTKLVIPGTPPGTFPAALPGFSANMFSTIEQQVFELMASDSLPKYNAWVTSGKPLLAQNSKMDLGTEAPVKGKAQGFIDSPSSSIESPATRRRAKTVGSKTIDPGFRPVSATSRLASIVASTPLDLEAGAGWDTLKESNTHKLSTIIATSDLFDPFCEFLASTYCIDNLNFYVDAERFRVAYGGDTLDYSSTAESQFKPTAQAGVGRDPMLIPHAIGIYLKYIAADAPCEINIGSNLKRQIGDVMEIAIGYAGFIDVGSFSSERPISTQSLLMPGIRSDMFPPHLNNFGAMMFAPVEAHIFRLMAGDLVPKFVKTDIYHEVMNRLWKSGTLPSKTTRKSLSLSVAASLDAAVTPSNSGAKTLPSAITDRPQQSAQ
ncbi:RGS domain-containing protein [Blyttiomyces helicus]|uniref:RGS domain-containing protein n=1 Tax=Blyttiomyces helicus TaxID=388810 RepID=A0A4P9WLX2_9FUNG|nr:RGS domain-containing protein [Blyttiomyces helicus]|eukprot:RKO93195.1 RGS domain-containing protein [Blyttiomyces helicus]